MITTFAHTIAKPGKTQNGDHVKIVENEDFILALLADGISSQACDHYASQLACGSMADFVQTHHESLTDREALLEQAMRHTNQQLLYETGKCEGLGTTLCGMFWETETDEMFYFWIGDSRIFFFAQQQLTQISIDDAELVSDPKHVSQGKPFLTNSLGRKDCQTRVLKKVFLPGEMLIMATDGFFEAAYSYEKDLVSNISKSDLEGAMKRLFQKYRADQKDDASLVVVRRTYPTPIDKELEGFFQSEDTSLDDVNSYYEAHLAFHAMRIGIDRRDGDICLKALNRIISPGIDLGRERLLDLLNQVVKADFNEHGIYRELGFLIRKS